MRRRRGYVLFETLVAMTLLSITMISVQRVIQQAVVMRGLAQDYTTVRFLLEGVIADMELQQEIAVKQETGTFQPPHDRFSYVIDITEIEVPRPELPSSIPPEERERLERRYNGEIPHVRVEVSWERAGNEYVKVAETIYDERKLWRPPELDANGTPIPR